MTKRAEVLNLFMKNQSKYKGFAYTLTLNWSTAEDAVQEAAMFVCDHWDQFTLGTNFDAWARTVVKNRCREMLRKEHSERRKAYRIAETIEEDVWDEVRSVDGAQISALHRCMEKLPEKTKKIVVMFYQESKKCNLISEIFKMKEDAIYKILSRVRKSLKTCINQEVKQA